MSDDIIKPKTSKIVKILLGICILSIVCLFIEISDLREKNKEFHENLYASQNGSFSQGTHGLSISDVYYQRYFNSNSDDKSSNDE